MKLRRNILALSVAIALGLALTACGNGASSDRTSAAVGRESSAEASGDEGAASPEETETTGTENTNTEATGSADAGAARTGSADAGAAGTGSADAGSTGTGNADAGAGNADAAGSILVAYFSHTGNTREAAQMIAEYTGGDLAEIKRAEEYGDLQEEAEVEILDGVHPEITVSVSNVSDYETIFVGYPIWWDEAPAMIATFLAENDFSGKLIIPFCTSASDDIGNSLHIFSELCPDAEIAEGLTANDLNDIEPWIQGLGILE